jgi:hypothetical protein
MEEVIDPLKLDDGGFYDLIMGIGHEGALGS